jgi:hypothetical protein
MKKIAKLIFLVFCISVFLLGLRNISTAIDTESEGYWVPVGQSKDVTGQSNCMKVTNNSCPGAIFVPTKTAAEWTGDASKGFLTHVPACASVADCVNCDVDVDSIKSVLSGCDDCDVFDHDYDIKQYRYKPNNIIRTSTGVNLSVFSFSSVLTDGSEGYYIAGLSSYDSRPGYLAKFGCDGNKLWSRAYFSDNGRNAFLLDVQKTSDGNLIAVGGVSFSSNLGSSYNDALIMKLDSDGSIIWAKSSGDNIQVVGERFIGVKQTSDGGYVGVGIKNGNSGYVVKFNSSGDKSWSKIIATEIYRAEQSSDGNIIIVGRNGSSAYIAKVSNADGSRIWSHSLPISQVVGLDNYSNFTFNSLIKDGSSFVASGVGDMYGVTPSAIVYKFDTSGTRSWGKIIIGSAFYSAGKLDDGSGYYCGGVMGESQPLIYKLNTAGSFVAAEHLPYNRDEFAAGYLWDVDQLSGGDLIGSGYNRGCDSSSSNCDGAIDAPWSTSANTIRIRSDFTSDGNSFSTFNVSTSPNINTDSFSNPNDSVTTRTSDMNDPDLTTDPYSPANCSTNPGC